jgi:predicted aspartyl protease
VGKFAFMADPEKKWIEIRGTQDVGQICKFGPLTPIEISPLDNSSKERTLALIDTGASHSCISSRLIERLKLVECGTVTQHTVGGDPKRVPIYGVRMLLPGGADIQGEFASATFPVNQRHDLLIGRDILQRCRLEINFTRGKVNLDINPD